MNSIITDLFSLQVRALVQAICKEYQSSDHMFESVLADKTKLMDDQRKQFCSIAHTLMHAPVSYLSIIFKLREIRIRRYLQDFKHQYQTDQSFAESTDRIANYYIQNTNDVDQVIRRYLLLKEKGRLYLQESERLFNLLQLRDESLTVQEIERLEEY